MRVVFGVVLVAFILPALWAFGVTGDQHGDPLPPGALLRLGSLRLRQEGPLRCVAFASDGTLISGGMIPTLCFWNPNSGNEVRRVAGPEKGVTAIVISRDGKRLAGIDNDGIAYIWDVDRGKIIRRFGGDKNRLSAIALSPNGHLLASSDVESIRVWDVATGQIVRTFAVKEGVVGEVCTVAFSPDAKMVAGGGSKGASLWDIDSGKMLHRLTEKDGHQVRCVVFAENGRILVATGEDTNRLWDVATGAKLKTLGGQDEGGVVAAFSRDGNVLAISCRDGAIRLWDWETKKELWTLRGHFDRVSSLSFAPDGKTLASGSSDHAIRLWDLTSGKPRVVGSGHQERLSALAYAPDGRTIATAAFDGTLRLWDARTGRELRTFKAGAGEDRQGFPSPEMLSRVAFSPDGKLVATVRGDETVVVWDIKSAKQVHTIRGGSIAFAPDGKLIAVGGRGTEGTEINMGVIRLHDAGWNLVRELRGHLTPIYALAFSGDGKSLVSRGHVLFGASYGLPGERETNFIRFWDVATGKERPGFPARTDLRSPALSPDDRTLATSTMGSNSITLLERATGQPRAELVGHAGMVFDAVFAPDQRTLATASMDGTIRLWDILTAKEIGRLVGHRGWVLAVAFAPDGRTLTSGGIDTTALVWDVSRFMKREHGRALTAADLEACWEDLLGDAKTAFCAIGRLVYSPKNATPFLRDRLKPALAVNTRQLAQLIAALDSDQFKTRVQAVRDLEKLGDLALPMIQRILAGNPTLETKQRLKPLLDKLERASLSPETLRQLRSVEALESIDSTESRELLSSLVEAGAPEARLTREAQAALRRRKLP